MALKPTLTKAEFEALPDATREAYKTTGVYLADGENWKLDAEIEDVSGLKSALKKEREAAAEAKKQLLAEQAKFKDLDPEKYAELLAKAEEKENAELKSKGNFEDFIKKHNAKFDAFKAEMEAKLAAKDKELDRTYIDARLRESFEKAGVMPDRIDDAVALTKPYARRNEKGELSLLDKDGETPLDVSIETYAKEMMKESKPWLYAASGAGGSGASNGTNGQARGADLSKLSPTERLKVANRAEAT